MPSPTDHQQRRPARSGAVSVEMLLVAVPLFVMFLIANASWRYRQADLHTRADAHQRLYRWLERRTPTVPAYTEEALYYTEANEDLLWFLGVPRAPGAAAFEFDSPPPDYLSVDGLNSVMHLGMSESSEIDAFPQSLANAPGTFEVSRYAYALGNPWTTPLDPSSTFAGFTQSYLGYLGFGSFDDRPQLTSWWQGGLDATTGPYRDPLKLAD